MYGVSTTEIWDKKYRSERAYKCNNCSAWRIVCMNNESTVHLSHQQWTKTKCMLTCQDQHGLGSAGRVITVCL